MRDKYFTQSMKDARASDGWLMNKSTTLKALRHYYEEGGHMVALLDAVQLCLKHSNKFEDGGAEYTDGIPNWVLKGCSNVLSGRIEDGLTIGLGQFGNEKGLSLKLNQHLLRYLAVEEVLDPKNNDGKPPSMNQAYKQALKKLHGTITGGVTPATVRNSHQKVKAEINMPGKEFLYYPVK